MLDMENKPEWNQVPRMPWQVQSQGHKAAWFSGTQTASCGQEWKAVGVIGSWTGLESCGQGTDWQATKSQGGRWVYWEVAFTEASCSKSGYYMPIY